MIIQKTKKLFGALTLLLTLFLAVQIPAQTKNPPGANAAEKPLPNLILNTINEKKWSLYENRGSVVLMNFWATWCAPCRKETPMLVKFDDEFKNRGLKIVGVALDENPELIRNFAAEFKMDYPILLPVPGSALARIEPVPTTLLIDANGILVKKYVGLLPEEILRRDVEKLVGKVNSKGTKVKKAKSR